jgi:hypothetical protein
VSASAAVLVIDMQIGLVSIGYQGHEVLLRMVSDAHTTKDALLPAEQIIKYHNSILPAVAHPDRCLIVKPSNEVLF